MTSLVDKWDYGHLNREKPQYYGLQETYLIAAEFLTDMDEVEDWGCGGGGFKPYCIGPRYIGIDGSRSPFVDQIVNLSDYRSECDGIMLRHVLEHNHDWEKILASAVLSFRKKLCLVLFTPFDESTGDRTGIKIVGSSYMRGVTIPDFSFRKSDIEPFFAGLNWNLETVSSKNTSEHVYKIWK